MDAGSDTTIAKELKKTLEKRGALKTIKAQIRSELYGAMDHSNEARSKSLSNRDLIINELIREYLSHRRLDYTTSVFTPESGQPEISLDRSLLAREFGIVEVDNKTRKLPLLFTLISMVHPKGWAFFDLKN